VRGLEAKLPPAFSLLQSEFNEFLYAPIGEESNDSVLTVLSALARLGLDPWQESARLAQLSTAMATETLTAIVARLPNGRWAQSDVGAIAGRLIQLLPAKRAAPLRARATAGAQRPGAPSIARACFVAVLGGAMLFVVLSHLNPAAVVNQDSPFSTTDSSPPVRSAGSK
jgi:hypothetical protein